MTQVVGLLSVALGVTLLVFRNSFLQDLTRFHRYGKRQAAIAKVWVYVVAAYAIIFGVLLITGIVHIK